VAGRFNCCQTPPPEELLDDEDDPLLEDDDEEPDDDELPLDDELVLDEEDEPMPEDELLAPQPVSSRIARKSAPYRAILVTKLVPRIRQFSARAVLMGSLI
jgi:hypothetical protein